ncbi:MAG: hypothetical protein ACYTEQ_14940 [Planctomycetota bacterium]|jgi:hypothetical protein
MASVLYIIAGPLFIVSVAGHIYVKTRLRPKEGSDLDDYYHEFEDRHPEYARYLKWSKITLTAAVISMLLLFIAAVI